MNFDALVIALTPDQKLDLSHIVVGSLNTVQRQEFLLIALESIFRKQNAEVSNLEYQLEELSSQHKEDER